MDTTTLVPHPAGGDVRDAADELLAVRCQLGERDAFEALIERFHTPLWRYLRRVAADESAAEELLQDVWLRVIRGIGRLRDPARVRPWLFGIARRLLMDRLRARYARPAAADVDVADLASAAVDDDVVERELAAMHEELARLPIVERDVLTLFYLRELSLAEAADVLGVPVGTVKSRLFRARQLLRRELDAAGKGRG
jgi:RNA polymerase sigma-70 factor (ECF subfamily)